MKYKDFRWMLVLPPVGFARAQGLAIVKAFQQELTDGVQVFDTQEVLHKAHTSLRSDEEPSAMDWMNQRMVVAALEWKISHILCLSLAPLDPHYLQVLRGQGLYTVHWLYEDHHLADYWSRVMGGYNLFCCNQHGAVQRECEQRDVQYHFLPLAAQIPINGAGTLWHARSLDLAFVGSPSPYRIQVLETLAASGLTLGIQGPGWEDHKGFLSRYIFRGNMDGVAAELELYRQARMAIHLSYGKPAADGEDRPVSPRVWDSIALGAYPMLERLPCNAASLDGLTYHEHQSPTELLALCIGLRQNGIDTETSIQNQQVVQRFHTLNHRVRELFDVVEGN